MNPDLGPSSTRASPPLGLLESSPPRSSEEELSLLAMASALLRSRRAILRWALLGGALCAVVSLARHRTFTSESSFLPQAQRTPQSLSGIAAQLGLSLPTADGSQGPAFYVDLLQSPTILGQVVDSSYTAPSLSRGAVSLPELYRVREESAALRREKTIERLGEDVNADFDGLTNVVKLGVRSRDPELSRALNERLLTLVNHFNQETRKSRAAAEREFTERRRAEVRDDLRAAEDRLQTFLQRNRDYQQSPQLAFERERLVREISQQSQLYSTISQAFEQAKIEEVRDTPVITVLETPDVPAKADSRHLVRYIVVGVVLGIMVGVAMALAGYFGEQLRARNKDEYATFAALRRAALRDLTRPMRLFGRSRSDDDG
jgi:uncharacterized protein involved in exopolysaccharide biosynthesis